MTFYTVHNAAGLIRSNKFGKLEDAICIASFRAQYLKLPIKIYEHVDKEQKTLLVCNPDGSVEAPQGAGNKFHEMGNAPGFSNNSQAHVLLASFDDKPITAFYLRNDLTHDKLQKLEKQSGVEIAYAASGDDEQRAINAYTQSPSKIREIESWLSENGVEVDDVAKSALRTHATAETVLAARKAQKRARASHLPELRVRSSSRFGAGHKFSAYCELKEEKGKTPMIHVYSDGEKLGEVRSEVEAKRLISSHAERSFKRYLRKELG